MSGEDMHDCLRREELVRPPSDEARTPENLLARASGMADQLGDGGWRSWTQSEANEVEGVLDALRERMAKLETLTKPAGLTRREDGHDPSVVELLIDAANEAGHDGTNPGGCEFCHAVARARAALEDR